MRDLDTPLHSLLNKDVSRLHKPFFLGLELETEGENLPRLGEGGQSSKYWKAVAEGSLRGGVEYVLKNPMPLDGVDVALNDWLKLKEKAKSEIYDSIRTSTHIHVNAAWLTARQLLNFLGVYYILEPCLVNMHGPSRTGNLFCLRVQDAESLIHSLIREIELGNIFHRSLNEVYRYAALNLSSLVKFGSVEFRFLKGMYDKPELYKWCAELQRLVMIGSKIDSLDTVLNISKNLAPYRFLEMFFSPEFVTEIVQSNEGLSAQFAQNRGIVKELSLAMKIKPKPQLRLSKHEDLRELKDLPMPEPDYNEDEEEEMNPRLRRRAWVPDAAGLEPPVQEVQPNLVNPAVIHWGGLANGEIENNNFRFNNGDIELVLRPQPIPVENRGD